MDIDNPRRLFRVSLFSMLHWNEIYKTAIACCWAFRPCASIYERMKTVVVFEGEIRGRGRRGMKGLVKI
jgi:hypothetical protein